MLLNVLNFQTLIATKTARIYQASRGGKVLEFGLRRAQGRDGALSASRAAYIGGAASTSNTLAGRVFGMPVSGTMAHSWVMAFNSEREAFERYAELYPDRTILLIDTYDTLKSGIVHAIEVGKRLQQQGKSFGIRLDSGDIQYLSERVRERLDDAGLKDAKIAVSNELNEEIIDQLVSRKAPIDLWGVGTHLVTGGHDSSLTGVYKLAARNENGKFIPTMKVSDNPEKTTNPGIKQVYRFYDSQNAPVADMITCNDEEPDFSSRLTFYHPFTEYRFFRLSPPYRAEPLLRLCMRSGRTAVPVPELTAIREYALESLGQFDDTYKRLLNPHVYKVSLSERLKNEKYAMVSRYLQEQARD
jgi:nicotinate phosphoribosyltransferase